MGGINRLDRALAEHDMTSAQEHSRKVKSQLAAEQVESLKVYQAFHAQLALLSGGTVALSVTYLGYLQHSGLKIVHIGVLVASWCCLVLAIPLSMFVSFLHSHYMYYSRMAEYHKAMSEQREAEAGALGRLPIVDMPLEQIPGERDRLTNVARDYQAKANRLGRFEKVYFNLWRIDGWAARSLFVLGLVLLLLFAGWNTLKPGAKTIPEDFVMGTTNFPTTGAAWPGL